MMADAVEVFNGPCSNDVPRLVRRTLIELRGTVGIPDSVIDDLVLIATELVTNAVRAGSKTISVELVPPPPLLTIRVTDDAAGEPVVIDATPEETAGRGLKILEAIAINWGFEPGKDRKTVWAQLPHE